MSNVVPKQSPRSAPQTSPLIVLDDPSAADHRTDRTGRTDRASDLTPRKRSEDVEQMFLDLTRRAPTPAVGPSHWWG